MSLADTIASVATSVFLNTDLFAESIVHFHPSRARATVAAIVCRDDMLKPPEGSGASRVIEDLDGERGAQLRTWAKVDIAISVDVAFMARSDHRQSEFEFADGTRWKAVAPEGSDSAMQTVWCVNVNRATTRKV